jgi:two-component system cell cycle response regulator
VGAQVLVVDDNGANLDLALYLLRAFGHAPLGASDGLAGLEAAQKDAYDLVLADILMPGIDGYEFARRFRAEREKAKTILVAVTALAMVGDKERILAAGFDGYIAKPIDPRTFVSQVEAFLPPVLRSISYAEHQSISEPTERAPAQGPLILVVDDVQVNIDVVKGMLDPFGYRVLEARGGDEGFALASQLKPDLILCDLHMPAGDGFEFIERIRAEPELAPVPFLFLSSTGKPSDRLRGMELGAAKFILRPIDPKRLLEEIASSLGREHVEHSRY